MGLLSLRIRRARKRYTGQSRRSRRGVASRLAVSSYNHLILLPAELLVQILEHLPNFSALLSAILAHSLIYKAFLASERRILLAVFCRQYKKWKRRWISQLFWEMVFAVRHEFVKRDLAEEVFTLGWKLFRQNDLEELLVPLGRALAWSFCLDNRENHAINLLTKLAHGVEPFDHKISQLELRNNMPRVEFLKMWPKITLLPVFELLDELKGQPGFTALNLNSKEFDVFIAGSKEDICVAEIQDTGIRIIPPQGNRGLFDRGNAVKIMKKLRYGIQFSGKRAIVGLVNPGRLQFYEL